MADQTAKGEDFEKQAEQFLTSWIIRLLFFETYLNDAVTFFKKAGICFKLGKNWDKAGSVYIKLANVYLKKPKNYRIDAASAYVDAARCYKKISVPDAEQSLNQAVNLYLEIGSLSTAAGYFKELGEINEQEQNLDKAIDYFERASDLFECEEFTNSANECKQKVAQFAAQLEQYPKAIQIYETIVQHSINTLPNYYIQGILLNAGICQLLKYDVQGILLNVGICQLCKNDVVAFTNTLEQYQKIDPTFSDTREYKLLIGLAEAMDEGDVAKFTNSLQNLYSMTWLIPWQKKLLLRVKNTINQSQRGRRRSSHLGYP